MLARHDQFPWQFWVRLAYNDALTFNGTKGGVNGSWRFSQYARAPQNRQMQGFSAFIHTLKENEKITFDKLSYSDFSVAAAFTAI
jgi:hypothetical protein